jgi:hypothetical protein
LPFLAHADLDRWVRFLTHPGTSWHGAIDERALPFLENGSIERRQAPDVVGENKSQAPGLGELRSPASLRADGSFWR